jgi:ferredoxin
MDAIAGMLIALGCCVLLALGLFGLSSLRERERRAAVWAFGLAAIGALVFFVSAILPNSLRLSLLLFLAGAAIVAAVIFLLPIGKASQSSGVPQARLDERDIMFSRARLEPGTKEYEAYYAMRPENKADDDKTRSLPGLLSPHASEADPLLFAATDASFGVCRELREAVDGRINSTRIRLDAAQMTAFVKGLARHLGARTVGIAELQPYHIYTHIGRGSGVYGAPIDLDHRFAVAFTVEMERAMVDTAPAAPTLLESARQYANAAQIAVQLGLLIRLLGYPARAHIDGDYRIVAPLVARDAGLGEIGRMGLLMTPELGPRVRLGAVTTDLPLVPDEHRPNSSVLDFCRICKKCATNCPVRAIPFDDRRKIDGALRWQINQDICYRFWCTLGTDCARCVAVCPYSHADNVAHNLVRWAVQRSGAARRTVLWLDDLFYGPEPRSKPAPAWVPPKIGENQ